MNSKQKILLLWQELNPRQQNYLKLIYKVDCEVEQAKKQQWLTDDRPASVWRWIFYGDISFMPSRLKRLLIEAELVDRGTGSTFNALEQRQFIECQGVVPDLEIKMTRLGRRIVRAGIGEPVAAKAPKGMLSEQKWNAFVLAYKAGESGLPEDLGRCRYGIHLSIWKSLLRQNPPLIELGRQLRVTLFGYAFYAKYYECYQAIYPSVDAPLPTITEADLERKMKETVEPSTELTRFTSGELVRFKRASRGLREIAAEIGSPVTPSALSRFENGKSIQPKQLEVILDWLKH
jgi:hypothetical protein